MLWTNEMPTQAAGPIPKAKSLLMCLNLDIFGWCLMQLSKYTTGTVSFSYSDVVTGGVVGGG